MDKINYEWPNPITPADGGMTLRLSLLPSGPPPLALGGSEHHTVAEGTPSVS